MRFVRLEVGKYDLMRAMCPRVAFPINQLWSGPTLGRDEDYHRPARPFRHIFLSRVLPYAAYVLDDGIEGLGKSLMHRVRILPFDNIRCPTVSAEEFCKLLLRNAGEDRRVRDFVTIQMQNG